MIDIAGIVQQALGKETVAGGVRPVSGGDINDAYLVTLAGGQKVFLKVNTPRNAAFFACRHQKNKCDRRAGSDCDGRVYRR